VPGVAIALITNYLTGYRVPLYQRLAEHLGVEVLCYGGGERYAPSWFRDLDRQLAEAPFPARRLRGAREAYAVADSYEAVIAPFAGGAILPAAYAGARRRGKPFVLWASVWAEPRSLTHVLARPVTRHIYRHAGAVVAYGEHVRRFVASIRGSDDDVFVAPQAVESELFAREVGREERERFREAHGLGTGPLVLYVGRLIEEKGVSVLLDAWPRVRDEATLVLIGEGPLAARSGTVDGVRLLGPMARPVLASAYAAAELTVLASIPTPRFREPWGLVCNESMQQGRPVVASDSVGAVAGGLVADGVNGLVVPSGDAGALTVAIDRLLGDSALRERLGATARETVKPFNYEAMEAGFARALAAAGSLPDGEEGLQVMAAEGLEGDHRVGPLDAGEG
jgi:glycosyltransferase involved in cell wall biosynthesis